MKITDFSVLMTKSNRGKIRLPKAQVDEVLRDSNHALGGYLYAVITAMPRREVNRNLKIPYSKICKLHKKLDIN